MDNEQNPVSSSTLRSTRSYAVNGTKISLKFLNNFSSLLPIPAPAKLVFGSALRIIEMVEVSSPALLTHPVVIPTLLSGHR